MSELLLIDDDQELCELLGSWLGQEGFPVRACHDGQSARKALAETAPAAVVLDVMLPDGSGLELLKQLRNDHPELPVLMLSARGEPRSEEHKSELQSLMRISYAVFHLKK